MIEIEAAIVPAPEVRVLCCGRRGQALGRSDSGGVVVLAKGNRVRDPTIIDVLALVVGHIAICRQGMCDHVYCFDDALRRDGQVEDANLDLDAVLLK